MAEISLEEAQEQQQLKTRVSKFSEKIGPGIAVANTGIKESYEIELWNKVVEGIGVGGHLAENWAQNSAKIQAHEIKKDLDADHENQMLNMIENLHQTPLENLDYADTVIGYNERHNADFRIGALNENGDPSVVIKEKPFDEYDVPWRQKEELEEHYNQLDNKRKEYILNELPGIMGAKIDMLLQDYSQELFNEGTALFSNSGSYDKGTVSLEDGSHWAIDAEQDRMIEVAGDSDLTKTIKVGGQDEYVYTEGLNPEGLSKLREIMTKFDNKLADLMSTGAISSQKAISVQRNFTQEMLNRQFTIEAARDPDGAYLKILNGDYYFERDLTWDKPGAEGKILQKISLNDIYTQDWVNSFHADKRVEHEQAMEEKQAEQFAILVEETDATVSQQEFLLNPNNTKDDVQHMYEDSGDKTSVAMSKALAWSITQKNAIDGKKNIALENTVSMLQQAFTNDPEAMSQLLGDEKSNGLVIAKSPAQLKKAISRMLENVLQEQKDTAELEGPPGHVNKITDKERREFIEWGVSKIERRHIQQFINNHIANNRSNEKSFYSMQLLKKTETVAGRHQLADEFFELDETSGTWSLNPDKVYSHENRKYYASDEEFAIPLMGVLKDFNEKEKAYKLANDQQLFLPEKSFHVAMMDFVNRHKMMMGNMFEGGHFDGLGSDPDREHEDPFHLAVHQFVEKDKSGYLKGVLAKEGINGLLTPHQRATMQRTNATVLQLGVWLKRAHPESHTKPSQLKAILKEMQHGKKSGHYFGPYTGQVGNQVKNELISRLDKVSPHKFKDTIKEECSLTENRANCIKQKQMKYGVTRRKVGNKTKLFLEGEEIITVTAKDGEVTEQILRIKEDNGWPESYQNMAEE